MNVYFVYKVLTNRIRALIRAAGYVPVYHVYQTLLPFFPLQFSEGAWCGGSGDETS